MYFQKNPRKICRILLQRAFFSTICASSIPWPCISFGIKINWFQLKCKIKLKRILCSFSKPCSSSWRQERVAWTNYLLDLAGFCLCEKTLTLEWKKAIALRALGLMSTKFPFRWADLVWAVTGWSLQLPGGCSPSAQAGATITRNLPLPVFQLSMTNEHFGNSFRHTHNPLSWRQQQKLMTVWIAGRQKMHYNGQQNCYPLQEGGSGGGVLY